MTQNISELDNYRKTQLKRMDISRLRECVAWGVVNAPESAETIYATELLNYTNMRIECDEYNKRADARRQAWVDKEFAA